MDSDYRLEFTNPTFWRWEIHRPLDGALHEASGGETSLMHKFDPNG